MRTGLLAAALLVSMTAWAVESDGSLSGAAAVPDLPGGGSNAITLTILNTYQPSYAQHYLGIECFDDVLLFVSSLDNKVFIADPSDLSYVGEVARPGGMYGFDVAWDGSEYYINGWGATTVIYHSDGVSGWTSFSNPSGANGRGMFYDAEDMYLWESNSSTNIYRFDTDGTGAVSYPLSGVSDQVSGLTWGPGFPTDDFGSLIVTHYNTPVMEFYMYTGAGLTLVETVACPDPTATKSYGLGWCESRGTLFWSYQNSTGYHISEVQVDMGGALDQDTWAGIKSSIE